MHFVRIRFFLSLRRLLDVYKRQVHTRLDIPLQILAHKWIMPLGKDGQILVIGLLGNEHMPVSYTHLSQAHFIAIHQRPAFSRRQILSFIFRATTLLF